jgi:CRP-like cAMP-binding protein
LPLASNDARHVIAALKRVGLNLEILLGAERRGREFLSLMLGVRRAGVTVALNRLERTAVIPLSRSKIVIVDRDGLIASANSAYRKTKR